MNEAYLHGIDETVLGAQLLTIRFRDPQKLVAKEGGAAGALAYKLAPQTIENKVYSETKRQMEEQFRSRGVDAEVKIVETEPPDRGRARGEFLRGLAIGGLVLFLGAYLLWGRA